MDEFPLNFAEIARGAPAPSGLAGCMQASGLGDTPRELLEEMGAIKSGEVILPAQQSDGTARQLGLESTLGPCRCQRIYSIKDSRPLRLPQRLPTP